jgi:hypothetical protein
MSEYGAPSDMVYKDIIRAEEYRRTVEKLDIFNAASGGGVVLDSDPARQLAEGGDFGEQARWKPIDGLISRRDNDNPGSAVATRKLEMASAKNVRQTTGCGPVAVSDIQARKAGRKFDMISAMVNLGQQFADAKMLSIRDNLIAAGVAAAANVSEHVMDVGVTSGSKVLCTMAQLNKLLGKMGDARESIAALLMPSVVFTDLVGDTITNYKMDRVAGVTIYRDVLQAFGRTVLVADVPSLITEGTGDDYNVYRVLGLGAGALRGTIIYDQGIELQRDILRESTMTYVREDFDTEYEVFGCKWDAVTDNPTNAEIADSANWAADHADHRQFKVVLGVFNGSV